MRGVAGLDVDVFASCVLGDWALSAPGVTKDVRDVEIADVTGFHAVVHLAAVCNDHVGDLMRCSTSGPRSRRSPRTAGPRSS
jgi:hypothetical protein